MSRPNANNAALCFGLALAFMYYTDLMVNVCIVALMLRALGWALLGR